jgi:hypothetical protein
MLTLEKIWQLVEFSKTEEAQHYIRALNQLFRKISLAVEALDLSEMEPKWLIDRLLDGFHRALEIHRAIPEHLQSSAGEDNLLFALRYIEKPEVVLSAFLEIALGRRCGDEAHSRLSPIALNIAGLMFLQGTYQNEDFKAIMKKLRAYTRRLYLPQEVRTSEHQKEKDAELRLKLTEQIDKLRDLSVEDFFIQAMEKKLDYLPQNIRERFINEIEEQVAQKRMPRSGSVSYDEEMKTEDGDKISGLEALEAQNEALQTQPQNVIEVVHIQKLKAGFTNSQKEALREFLNKTELCILEYIIRNPEATQEEIAREVECTQSKVSKAKKKFSQHAQKIKAILGLG